MRCLALADTLQREGAATRFISRHLPEHLDALLTQRGHGFVRLATTLNPGDVDELKHAHWLGTSQLSDARATSASLSDRTWDWVVVDHYAFDSRWESAIRAHVKKIMAIDDLADRTHDCDLLLDQNLHVGMEGRYRGLIPAKSASLFGPMYALLRPEFELLRRAAGIRSAGVRRVLVSMGGVDATNQTEKAIHAVAGLGRPPLSVDVIIGAEHPARKRVESLTRQFSYKCHVQAANVAELMAGADLAIGAAGVSSWERCCLGLPALCVTQAGNQIPIAKALEAQGAIVYLGDAERITEADLQESLAALMDRPDRLTALSKAAHTLTDGNGTRRVSNHLREPS